MVGALVRDRLPVSIYHDEAVLGGLVDNGIPLDQAREEEHEPRDHQRQADEDEGDDDVHADLRPDRRRAVRLTTATELTGMMMAATTGVTQPARHRATASRL